MSYCPGPLEAFSQIVKGWVLGIPHIPAKIT